jgi:hypothetical protein
MAFAVRNLSVLAYANGFTLWHYKILGDDPKNAGKSGFFTPAGDMLCVGDMVMVSGTAGASLMCLLADGAGFKATPLC